jgi:two-component system, chemotaxis family, response regulator WspF
VKIGIVDNHPSADALRRAVTLMPEHRVIWIATTDDEVTDRCTAENPDLILLNVHASGVDGVEATRRIMAQAPCAILVVTSGTHADPGRVFAAVGHGALDTVDVPSLGIGDLRESAAPLLAKIATISRRMSNRNGLKRAGNHGDRDVAKSARNQLVAIGASAGGPAAIATLLSGLSMDFPAAIVIVQHVDERFTESITDWLRQHTRLPVSVAREGDRPRQGCVLVAGTGGHLALKAADRLGYTPQPRHYAYRPSVDVFFQSVSRVWLGDAIGVLLTGMGKDGALGLKALRDQGHHTIAQDEATSAVYGMPKAAAALKAAVETLPIERIAARLIKVLARKSAQVAK